MQFIIDNNYSKYSIIKNIFKIILIVSYPVQSILKPLLLIGSILISLNCFSSSNNNAVELVFISKSHHSSVIAKPEFVKVTIIPGRKGGIFNAGKIHYRIHIQNTFKEAQDGTVIFKVITDRNKIVTGGKYEIHINPKSSINIRTKFKIEESGFYDYITQVNISDYDDTIKNVFAYKPSLITSPLYKPDDFEQFWIKAKKELAAVNPNYKFYFYNSKSTATHKVYYVEMQSLDNVTIHGWFSIPNLPGKFPVLILLPGYNQKFEPFLADDQATLCLQVRSVDQLTKKDKNPKNQTEYCLVNIDDKDNYIYRGTYMDCVRAVDFVCNNYQQGLDTSRIIVMGGSQGGALALVTAALDHRIAICGSDNPFYCDMHSYYDIASSKTPDNFPIKLLTYYYHNNKTPKKSLMKTLDYYDVQNFVHYIKCPTIIGMGTLDPIAPPACVYATFNKLNYKTKKLSEVHILPNTGHTITEEFAYLKLLWIEENTVNKMGQ